MVFGDFPGKYWCYEKILEENFLDDFIADKKGNGSGDCKFWNLKVMEFFNDSDW